VINRLSYNFAKEKIEGMKRFNKAGRISVASFAVAMCFLAGFSSRSTANPMGNAPVSPKAAKSVHINVEIHGQIDGHTAEAVEHIVMAWLEAAHVAVSHADGTDTLSLHIRLDVTDNHHFKVHSDCADWHEDQEVATVEAINEILHVMVNHFIDKYIH